MKNMNYKNNAVNFFIQQEQEHPQKMALWTPSGEVSFSELKSLAQGLQTELQPYKVRPGDSVLLLVPLNPRLFGIILGLLGLGVNILLVEPWLPLHRVEEIVRKMKPKAFITSSFGRLWGLRIKAVRQIPIWLSASKVNFRSNKELLVNEMPPEAPAIISFTSGTSSGFPKGVVRSHGFLQNQHQVLSHSLNKGKSTPLSGPDLCIFANFALLNLASGRSSLLIPSSWSKNHLLKASSHKPESLTCGPSFLAQLMSLRLQASSHTTNSSGLPFESLKSFHVGGALADCDFYEKAMSFWSSDFNDSNSDHAHTHTHTHWSHIYGSSEAEPVALGNLAECIQKSRSKNFFQTLCLGQVIPEISYNLNENETWVQGPHVASLYVDLTEAPLKTPDSKNQIWHNMGDRIHEENNYWYYAGRSQQTEENFFLEQRIYFYLKSSLSFIHQKGEKKYLVGENLKKRRLEIISHFPVLTEVLEVPIIRDLRHRSRIDRFQSLKKACPWLLK